MAYSGGAVVIPLSVHLAAEAIVEASVGVDLDAAAADEYVLICPVPLMIYAFGASVTETFAATMAGSVFIDHAPTIAGTDVQIVEWDLDTTTHLKGDGTNPLQTAATGSESFSAGEVIFAPASAFPYVVPSCRVVTLRHVDSGTVAGEAAFFLVARWMPIDLRMDTAWGNSA